MQAENRGDGKIVGEEDNKGARGKGEGAALVGSAVAPAREKSGRFPASTRRPICPPCSTTQYIDALALMRQGYIVAEVVRGSGAECWDAIKEYALANYPHDWAEIERAYKAARIDRLADKAQAVAEQLEPAMRQAVKGADGGYTTTRQRRTESGMITAALAAIAPEIHGRGAGRQAPGVTVNGNAAIFQGSPPPAGLDTWTPNPA